MADFAPYQDIAPDRNRALSPPPPNARRSPAVTSPRASIEQPRRARGIDGLDGAIRTPIEAPQPSSYQRSGDYFSDQNAWQDPDDVLPSPPQEHRTTGSGFGARWGLGFNGGGREDVDLFETRLGIRMDIEACLAYVLLPPLGGVLLLLLEHTSDYVRYHAWQSSLLFTFIFIIHIILSWSSFISWSLLAFDICLIAYLTAKAYIDAATLDRFQVPVFGSLANSILNDE